MAQAQQAKSLVPTGKDREEIAAMEKAISNSQWSGKLQVSEKWELARTAIMYDLDPLLGHLVVLGGKVYPTNPGLIKNAHDTGELDGIETTEPVWDEDEKEWKVKATVYRKGRSKPFVGYGRASKATVRMGTIHQFLPEMAETRAVNRALRKAFSISMTSYEEMAHGSLRPADAIQITATPVNGDAPAAGVAGLKDRLDAAKNGKVTVTDGRKDAELTDKGQALMDETRLADARDGYKKALAIAGLGVRKNADQIGKILVAAGVENVDSAEDYTRASDAILNWAEAQGAGKQAPQDGPVGPTPPPIEGEQGEL